jgi:hypothetical protein
LIIRGLQRGLANAMRAKGAEGDEEELAVAAVAHIASDLILAGQGRDVLAIYAQAAPKSDDGDDQPGGHKSPLVRALERLPGMVQGPEQSRADDGEAGNAVIPAIQAPGATYPQSVAPSGQPFFTPQGQLLPADLVPLDVSAHAVSRGPDARAAGRPGHPLPPGSPPSPLHTPVDTGNFEKKSQAEAGADPAEAGAE